MQGLIFAIFHFEEKGSSFIDFLIILVRWIASTGTLSLRNYVEMYSILKRLGSWNIFSNEGTSTLCKTKSSHSFWIC